MSTDSIKTPVLKTAKPKRDLGHPILVVINTLLIFIASQFLAAFLVELMVALAHHGATGFFDQSAAAQFLYILLAESFAVAMVYLSIIRRKLKPSFIGLGRRPVLGDLWRALLGAAVFYGLLIVASMLLNLILPGFKTNQPQDVGFNQIKTVSDSVIAFIALVIIPPLGEEPLMRGYLYSGLRARLKYWPALIITSLFFGIAHLQIGSGAPLVWGAAINTFILSGVLVYLRENTGALYAGILVHLINNVIAYGAHFH